MEVHASMSILNDLYTYTYTQIRSYIHVHVRKRSFSTCGEDIGLEFKTRRTIHPLLSVSLIMFDLRSVRVAP